MEAVDSFSSQPPNIRQTFCVRYMCRRRRASLVTSTKLRGGGKGEYSIRCSVFGLAVLADVEAQKLCEEKSHCSKCPLHGETSLILTLESSSSNLLVTTLFSLFSSKVSRPRGVRELMFLQMLIGFSVLAAAISKQDSEHRVLDKVIKKSQVSFFSVFNLKFLDTQFFPFYREFA